MHDKIKIFKNTEEIAAEFATMLLQMEKQANGEAVHIALSGGSTPKAIFKYLAKHFGEQLCSTQFHFWWGDDRCVPPTDEDSNYKWANDLWLSPIGIPKENIHRVLGENNPEQEAIRYSEEIKSTVPSENGWPVFDIMLLGLGEDGHTASIFPDQMQLLQSGKICAVATHPESGQKRITMTGPVINNSRQIVFLATGEKKAEKVKEILIDQHINLPATNIHSNNLVWWLDLNSSKLLQ